MAAVESGIPRIPISIRALYSSAACARAYLVGGNARSIASMQ